MSWDETIKKSVDQAIADVNSRSIKKVLKTGSDGQKKAKQFESERKKVRLLTRAATQRLLGTKARIYIMPSHSSGGAIKVVSEPAAAVAAIYGLSNIPEVVGFVMSNIKLINNVTDWRQIPRKKVIRIPSLNHLKSYWLNPLGEVDPEKHWAENVKSLYDGRKDIVVNHSSGEGTLEVNQKIFAPLQAGPCLIIGTLTVKFGITIKLEPNSNLKMKNKVKYSFGDSKGWKPESTLFAALTQGEIGSEIEFGMDKISAKVDLPNSKVELRAGKSIALKMTQKAFKLKVNDRIWKVETYVEFDYEVDYAICPPFESPPRIAPEVDFKKYSEPSYDEWVIWGILLKIGEFAFKFLDRLTSRIPIIMPIHMRPYFEERTGLPMEA